MFRLTFKRAVTALALISLAGISSAQGLPRPSSNPRPWFLGYWTCNIDGRTGWMRWSAMNNATDCKGGICPSFSSMAYEGAFRDGGRGWIRLIAPSRDGNDLSFIFTGDHTPWFLRYDPNTWVATGNTVWRGKKYPLQCSLDEGSRRRADPTR